MQKDGMRKHLYQIIQSELCFLGMFFFLQYTVLSCHKLSLSTKEKGNNKYISISIFAMKML